MVSLRKLSLLPLLLLPILLMGFKKHKQAPLVLSRLCYYNYHQHWGLSSTGAVAGFPDAVKNDSIPINDLEGLNKIFASVKPKKIFPGKLGGGNLFCGGMAEDGYHKILICYKTSIIDYTTNSEYYVKDSASQNYLAKLNVNIRQ